MNKRFETKMEAKLLIKFGKIFNQIENNLIEEKIVKMEDVSVIDPASVCQVVAKSEEAKRFIVSFVVDGELPKISSLDFTCDNHENIASSKYSISYLKYIMDIFDVMDFSVRVTMKCDFPIQIENDHFKIMLAPRVEN